MRTVFRPLWALALLAVAPFALAQPTPVAPANSQPVRIVVPYYATDYEDSLARIVFGQPDKTARRPYVIANLPGDNAHFGAEVVAKSRPDGQTLLFAPMVDYAAAVSQYSKMHYDLLAEFTPVTLVANAPHALVIHPALRITTIANVIALAKARPGQINWGSYGPTSLSRLEMEMFAQLGGIKVDGEPANNRSVGISELLSGNSALLFDSIGTVLPYSQSGKLRVLAVASAKRSPALPQVPTVAESGVREFEADYWYCILAPEGVDPATIKIFNEDLSRAVNSDEARKRLLSYGIEARASTPAELAKIMHSEVAKWAKVIKQAGIAPN